MSVNSSSLDDPSLPAQLPSNSSFHSFFKCFSFRTNIYIFSAISIIHLLLLPLLIFVLYLGYQQWRKQRSISTATTSHSDLFTYHTIAMQLNELLGFVLIFCGDYINLPDVTSVGLSIWAVTSLGQSLFHLLTCVERYLAVVHPIIYVGLRQAGGVRIRNISIGCVWLLSFGWIAVGYLSSDELEFILYICNMVFCLIVISFCSISVLRALKRPGPGAVGGNRERVDQSKHRAFHIIMAIMAVLLLSFGGGLLFQLMYTPSKLSDLCAGFLVASWFKLPSTFVLPLLFLHRAGKLQCCKPKTESG